MTRTMMTAERENKNVENNEVVKSQTESLISHMDQGYMLCGNYDNALAL